MFMRLRPGYSYLEAVPSLIRQSWDHPQLRHWMRFTPRLISPCMTTIRATTALPWAETGPQAPNNAVHELLTSLRAMPDSNVFILEEDQNYIREEVHHMFGWLKDDLVANWYSHLRVSGQNAFSTLIDHLHEWGVHYEAEGCFLTLSLLACMESQCSPGMDGS